jgi:hypothetical protein
MVLPPRSIATCENMLNNELFATVRMYASLGAFPTYLIYFEMCTTSLTFVPVTGI